MEKSQPAAFYFLFDGDDSKTSREGRERKKEEKDKDSEREYFSVLQQKNIHTMDKTIKRPDTVTSKMLYTPSKKQSKCCSFLPLRRYGSY